MIIDIPLIIKYLCYCIAGVVAIIAILGNPFMKTHKSKGIFRENVRSVFD